MKNVDVIILALVVLGIAYLFLKDHIKLPGLAKGKPDIDLKVLSEKTLTKTQDYLPGTDIPVGLRPRPWQG